jgi:hypothetical protein
MLAPFGACCGKGFHAEAAMEKPAMVAMENKQRQMSK